MISMSTNTTPAYSSRGAAPILYICEAKLEGIVSPRCTMIRSEFMKGEKNTCPYSLKSPAWHLQ